MSKLEKVAHIKDTAGGFVAGIMGAMAFGFIPIFSKPAVSLGLSPSCILFYRFFISTIILGVIFLIQGKSVKISLKCLPSMILTSIFYCFSSGLLVMGYKYMSGGVTGIIHFTYPIFIMIILVIFFREHIRKSSIIAILFALAGIYCLGILGGTESFIPGTNKVAGILIVLASGLACASYMICVNKTEAHKLSSLLLTFWLLLISAVIFGILALADGELVLVTDAPTIVNFIGLAVVATVLANFLLVYSIKHIGSTLAGILGAVEPATAVIGCIIVFGESLTLPIAFGIVMIFVSVGIVIMRNGVKH